MLITCAVNAQTIPGKITGDNARPVPYAFIYLLNTNVSAFSDADGNFSLKNISAGTYILSVSAAGYATVNKNITVSNTTNETVNIYLPDASKTSG